MELTVSQRRIRSRKTQSQTDTQKKPLSARLTYALRGRLTPPRGTKRSWKTNQGGRRAKTKSRISYKRRVSVVFTHAPRPESRAQNTQHARASFLSPFLCPPPSVVQSADFSFHSFASAAAIYRSQSATLTCASASLPRRAPLLFVPSCRERSSTTALSDLSRAGAESRVYCTGASDDDGKSKQATRRVKGEKKKQS